MLQKMGMKHRVRSYAVKLLFPPVFNLSCHLFRFYFFRLLKGKIDGLENIPEDNGCIMACNHSSYLDFFVVYAYFKTRTNRKARFLGKAEINYNWLWRLYIRYSETIVVDYDNLLSVKQSFIEINNELSQKNIILIFPEGTRSDSGKLQKAKEGVAHFLVANRDISLLPVGLTGFYDAWPRHKRCLCLSGVPARIVIGKPIQYHLSEYANKKEAKKAVTAKVMKEIATLINDEYHHE